MAVKNKSNKFNWLTLMLRYWLIFIDARKLIPRIIMITPFIRFTLAVTLNHFKLLPR